MFNIQSSIITAIIIYLFSNNWANISNFSKKTTSLIFCLKLFISLALFYYFVEFLNYGKKNDLYVYYSQALKLYETLNGNSKAVLSILIGNNEEHQSVLNQLSFWKRDFDYGILNDNQTMIRIHLFFLLILGKSILNHLLIFHIISFTSILLLIKTLVNQTNIRKGILLILLIIPSIAIWSSSTYKESIAISIHSIIITMILKINQKFELKKLIILLLICAVHLLIKPTYLIIIIPFLICFLVYKTTAIKSWINRIMILSIVFTTTITSLSINNSDIEKDEYKNGNKFNLFKMIEYKQDDFFYEAYERKAETLLKLTPLKINNFSFLTTMKEAILNMFFTPSFLYPSKLLGIPFLLENLLLYFFVFTGLKNNRFQNLKPIDKFLFISGITICLFAGIITPVLGIVLKFKSIGYLYLIIGLIKINFQTQK